MGGTGGGIAYNREEFEEICNRGLDLSPTNELLIDESLIGWKEYEMEVVRDKKDNCIIVCSIENFDPMGVHTGDSITVAPAQTLTDKEYQIMRNASMAVLREIGVETGGSNVQFAINPKTGRLIVIEMNPRVSRSSALASKATGFPIAKVAAKLAVGYTLDELKNDITGGRTPASFEPSIDYVVTKIPRFAFEKFPEADARLTTQMKSVGEVMAIGRTFQESVQKALRGLEVGATGFDPKLDLNDPEAESILKRELTVPSAERIWYVADAFRAGMSVDEVFDLTNIDRWFLVQIEELVKDEERVKTLGLSAIDRDLMHKLKRKGFSDARLAKLLGVTEKNLRNHRHKLKVLPVYKRVDTCAAEFATDTAYMYSTYEEECEANPPVDPRQDHGAGRRSEPHRPGHRVRLLLRARRAGAARRRLRDHHGQLQPGNRLHRLRHLRPPVLRAGDPGRRAGNRAHREAEGRDRAVRRPDPAEALARPGSRRRADHRHQPGRHRPRRRPRALPAGGPASEPAPAGQRHRAQRRPGPGAVEEDRLPAGGAPVLRAGRPRDGNRLRGRRPRALHARGREGVQRLRRCCWTAS